MGFRCVTSIIGCFVAGLLAVDLAGAGTVRYVSPSGAETSGYTSWALAAKTVQKAVDACVDGDTILVTNGTYFVTNHIWIIKGINLVGFGGAERTIIDGGGASRGILLSHSNAIVQGFSVINCRGTVPQGNGNAGGILVETNGTVRDCIIRNCFGKSGGGIYLKLGGTVRNCLIVSNEVGATGYGGGVMAQEGGIVENCTIVGNSASLGSAGFCFDGNGAQVVNSIIYDNIGSEDVGLYHATVGNISYSCFTPFRAGAGNTTNAPSFVRGYHLSNSSPCLDKGTNQTWMTGALDLDGYPRIGNGTVDMGVYENSAPQVWISVASLDIAWMSRTGATYQVQWTSAIIQPAWSNLGGTVIGTGSRIYTNEIIRDLPQRCYRVIESP